MRFLCRREDGVRPGLRADPRFRNFAEFTGCSLTKVAGRDQVNGDHHYLLGMLVSAHLDAARPAWKRSVFTEPGGLVAEARRAVQ